MADQIKQIYAGTAYIGQLSDGVPIASTNATTQNTVKDITVQNNTVLSQLGINTNFVVNGFNEGSLNTSLTGSEYIDVSSTAVAVATASFTNEVFAFFGPTNSTGAKATSLSTRKVSSAQASVAATQSAALSTALSQSSGIVAHYFVGADFFYIYDNGDTNKILYRRVGGVNGTQNIVFNDSYASIVFNGVDKFYQVRANDIRTYTPATNTTTTVTIQSGGGWPASLSSYPRISFANGLVFWYNNASQNVYAINPTTGYVAQIVGATVGASANIYTPLEVYYTGGTYYILSSGNSATSGYVYIYTAADFGPLTSASISSVSSTPIYYTPTAIIQANVYVSEFWPKLNRTNGDWFWFKSSTSNVHTFGCLNIATQTFKNDLIINTNTYAPTVGSISTFVLSSVTSTDDSSNKTNTTHYPQSISLRVTGVQTTL